MVKEIVNIMVHKLAGLPFLDLVAGVAQSVIDVRADDENIKIVKKMPVSYDVLGGKSAILGMERELVPNSGRKGILYFEDFGSDIDSNGRATPAFTPLISNIRLVCWLNKKKMALDKYDEITAVCMAEIIRRVVSGTGFNGNGVTRLFVSVGRIPIQDAAIFSRYNYLEAELQYLRPPFEYFAIDFVAKYSIATNCLPPTFL